MPEDYFRTVKPEKKTGEEKEKTGEENEKTGGEKEKTADNEAKKEIEGKQMEVCDEVKPPTGGQATEFAAKASTSKTVDEGPDKPDQAGDQPGNKPETRENKSVKPPDQKSAKKRKAESEICPVNFVMINTYPVNNFIINYSF